MCLHCRTAWGKCTFSVKGGQLHPLLFASLSLSSSCFFPVCGIHHYSGEIRVNPQSSDTLCYQTCWNSLASPLNNLVLMISRNVGSFIVFWNQLAMAEVDCCWDNEPGRDRAGPLPEPYVNEPALSITLATIGCQKFPELLVCFVYLADSSISLKASHSGLIYFCTFSFFRV